jgi:hypothetical protein
VKSWETRTIEMANQTEPCTSEMFFLSSSNNSQEMSRKIYFKGNTRKQLREMWKRVQNTLKGPHIENRQLMGIKWYGKEHEKWFVFMINDSESMITSKDWCFHCFKAKSDSEFVFVYSVLYTPSWDQKRGNKEEVSTKRKDVRILSHAFLSLSCHSMWNERDPTEWLLMMSGRESVRKEWMNDSLGLLGWET